ncbi:hypothetical protein B7486_53240, partial [cyanobacterium TDX16]
MVEPAGPRATARLEAVGAAALVATAALLPVQGVRWRGGARLEVNDAVDKAVGLLPSDLTLLVAFVVGGVLLVCRRRLPLRVPKALLVGEGLLLVGGLAGLVSAEHPYSAGLLWRTVAVVLLCQVAAWGIAPAGRRLVAVGVAYVGGAAASCAVGVVALLAAGENRFTNGSGRAVGLAGNATTLALLSALALALSLVAAIEADGRAARRAWAAACVVLGAGLAASGARGVVLTTVVVVVLLCWRAWRVGRRPVVVGAAATLVGVLVLGLAGADTVPVVDRLLEREQSVAGETAGESSDVRLDQVGEEVERRGPHSLLVGSGLRDDEPTEGDVRAGRLNDPHTAHLEVWLGTGLLGLVGWLLVWWAAIAPGARLLVGRRPLAAAVVPVAALAAASSTFVLGALTANNLWNRYVWLLVAFAALAAGRRDSKA